MVAVWHRRSSSGQATAGGLNIGARCASHFGMRRILQIVGVCAVVLFAGEVDAAEAQNEPIYPPHEVFAPGAALLEVARRSDVPLTGIDQVLERQRVLPGDRAVVLVSLRDGDTVEQWLVDFQVAVLSEEERTNLAENPPQQMTLHTSTGRSFTFGFDPVAVEVWVAGPLKLSEKNPVRAADRAKTRRARFVVNGEYLGLGLDQAAEAILNLADAETGRLGLEARNTEFGAEDTAANRQLLAERGLTEELEKSVVGAMPALMAFFNIAAQTPGLKEILFEVVDVPWWKVIKSLGELSTNFHFDGFRLRRVPDSPGRYIIPLGVDINGATVLRTELVAGRAYAPLTTLAGITALYAGQPDGRGPRLAIALLSATAAAAPKMSP